MTTDLTRLTASALHDLFERGEVSCREITSAHLETIRAHDARYGAYLHVLGEGALQAADEVDRRRLAGEEMGALSGVPVALKDVIVLEGVPATAGSRILEGWIAPYTATAALRLMGGGSPVLGKTNCDEFAMGSSTETSAYFPTRNPRDPERVPGGSSGGSAAAVAAFEAPVALGSETGGSVRQPAAFCGVVGLKPTYGRVSRYGLVAFSSSMDQIGPLGRTVEDTARLLAVIAGRDAHDMTSSPAPVGDYLAELDRSVAGVRFALPDAFLDHAGPALREATENAARALEAAGAQRVEIDLPSLEFALAVYHIVSRAEASSNLARFDGVRYGPGAPADDLLDLYLESRGRGFGREVKRRIMLGTYVLSEGYYDAFYMKAQRVRSLIAEDFERAFRTADVILTPTTPDTAFRLGEKIDDPMAMYAQDIMTLPANLAGIPALSVPVGTSRGLPVGVQVMGRPFEEGLLFRTGRLLETLSGEDRADA